MKKNLLVLLLLLTAGFLSAQTTYYWVGGTGSTSFTNNANWNTALNGSGTSRSAEAASDILIIDGSNIGGATPSTGTVGLIVPALSYVGQLKLVNNAVLNFTCASGTDSVVISGGNGDDLVVEAGSSLSLIGAGSGVIVLPVATSGRISGAFAASGGGHRVLTQTTGGLVFSGTATATVNSTSYVFGSASASTIAAQLSVVFESGAHLYYNGGNSPMGNSSTFAAIDFRPGSNYHIRAANATGSYLNSKSFGNVFIENNISFTSDGPIFRMGDLTIDAGSSFTTHTSGNTAILGNLVVNGSFAFPVTPSVSTNVIIMGGNSLQTITGSGTLNLPSLTVADNSSVRLERDITVNTAVNVFGKLDFQTYRINGSAAFSTRVNETANATSGTLTAGSYTITNASGLAGVAGLTVAGAGIPANTSVISFSTGSALLTLSNPITTSGTGIALTFSSDTSTLITANTAGFEDGTGSVNVTGAKTYKSGTNYTINAATEKPFGVSATGNVRIGHLVINAPVKVNYAPEIYGRLEINSKLSLRPDDTLLIRNGAVINGNFNNNNYIVTPGDASDGEQALVLLENLSAATAVPVGGDNYYLPVVLTPTATGNYSVAVIEGITDNGLVSGTPLSALEKNRFVNAVWQIHQLSGTGAANISLQWDNALEGSAFTTLADSEIGLVTNTAGAWSSPVNTGNNSANTASADITDFGVFAVGATAQVDPFVFNELPAKIYGDADFNGGATSLNTAQPIVYTSSDPSVATIVNGDIHITGTGTATITASQAADGAYPAVSISRSLTVSKASLTIKADDKTSPEGEALPVLTVSYTGFVYNETSGVLLTPAQTATTATSASAVGQYPITVGGATAANYTVVFQEGVLTILPKQTQTITFNAPAAKKYGNADFAAGGTSTNATIPVTYVSSNTNVATINGGMIHITGAGTTTITASQAGSPLYFPAASVSRTLTVDKAALTIAVRDTSKVEGQQNPDFTFVYTGFVNGETAANLITAPSVNTTATAASSAGYYTITPANATSNNYTITFTAGRLTILPAAGADRPYLNAYMPNSTTLTTRIFSNAPALTDVVIWDLNGKPLIRRNTFLPKGFISVDLTVGGVPSGVYIVTVRGSGVDLKQMIRIIR